jgi:hypothetical protein
MRLGLLNQVLQQAEERAARRGVPSQGSHPGGRVGVGERPRPPGEAPTRNEGLVSKSIYGRRKPTDAEREERRAAERERVKQAVEQLLTSAGWQRWVVARSMFRNYSAHNTMLLALEFHLRGIDPEPVAGFRTWLKLGRAVRKGERGIRIAARVAQRETDTEANATEATGTNELAKQRPPRFTTVAVFSVSQTDPVPGAEQLPLAPPCMPLTGDSHAHLLAPMQMFTESLGFAVDFQPIPGATGGWCDQKARRIVVDASQPANAQLRILIHETIHAMGVGYSEYGRERAEVIVDTATYLAAASVGLDVSGESVPYIAGWGEDGELEAVTIFATTIDELARRVENALTEEPDIGSTDA